MPLRRLWPLACLLPSLACGAPDPVLARFAAVDAAPVKTFIYVGTVTLAAGRFVHQPGGFTAPYTAKVFPYFFYSESGKMTIRVSDEDLRRIAAGQSIAFRGTAVRSDGLTRPLEGTATPTGPAGGQLKVKLHVTKRVVLPFATTYRLPAASAAVTGSAARSP